MKFCPTCGSDKREVKFTSHFSGMPILECSDPWHGCDSAKESAEPEEWISVDRRLPEMDGITYLVYRIEHKSGVRFIDTFTAQGQAAWHNRRRNLASGITHWRPLPKPPEHAQKGK